MDFGTILGGSGIPSGTPEKVNKGHFFEDSPREPPGEPPGDPGDPPGHFRLFWDQFGIILGYILGAFLDNSRIDFKG